MVRIGIPRQFFLAMLWQTQKFTLLLQGERLAGSLLLSGSLGPASAPVSWLTEELLSQGALHSEAKQSEVIKPLLFSQEQDTLHDNAYSSTPLQVSHSFVGHHSLTSSSAQFCLFLSPQSIDFQQISCTSISISASSEEPNQQQLPLFVLWLLSS